MALAKTGALSSLLFSRYPGYRSWSLVQSRVIFANVSADSLITVSYIIIFCCLAWIARKLKLLDSFGGYQRIFVFLGVFILAVGFTHVMDMLTIWWPTYPHATTVKMLCAAASLLMALLLARETPTLARRCGHCSSAELDADRSRAEQNLATAYAQLNSVLESAPDAVIKIDREWTLVYGNRKALSGLPDFVLGKNYWECFGEVRGTPLEEMLRNAMERQTEAAYEIFYEPYQKWYQGHIRPAGDGLSIFFSDITAAKVLKAELEQSRYLKEKRIEALSHMAGGLAHEINNPLAIIYAKANDLVKAASVAEVLPAAEVRRVGEIIIRTSDRAIRILRGLKGFARDADEDPMETASVYEIVDQCLELQGSRFERRKVELRVDLKADLPYLECRETQIGQIITNLLNNAFDAIVQGKSEERWVQLSAARRGGWLDVDVADSGPGIDVKVKDHLMEAFITTKPAGQGIGIGLSLSSAIALEHGGTLSLRTDTPHTCFRLTLPVAAAVQITGQEESQS